ncbi:hypothetical protein QBC46DRAFT_368424 [Diplogelasinospora grovesii]|uniref:Uncharacterized protein n=1 Tax=Diplogelasinospora grovesii TaxID=303347 RepID=A0AAN6MW70_9PEZI|nr:hypothetical protein QBC46DRAFT_368424 [Diplogelasinospora grovesii]
MTTTGLFKSPALAGFNWDIIERGVVESFKWSRPFPDDGTDPGGFHVNCKAERSFHAKMYKLEDLPSEPPEGLAPWHEVIEDFLGHRDYMGSWDGVDHKGQDREIVVMEYAAVPLPVRAWIEEQQEETNNNRWLFAVLEKPKKEGDKITGILSPRSTIPLREEQTGDRKAGMEIADKDKIMVFPAGAIYEILPLWVSKGSKCERDLSNLAKYRAQAADHSILAWPVDHTKPNRELGKRDITFKIEAMSVTETDEGKRARLMWEKLHRAVKRNERRIQREERQKARKNIEGGRIKDEL